MEIADVSVEFLATKVARRLRRAASTIREEIDELPNGPVVTRPLLASVNVDLEPVVAFMFGTYFSSSSAGGAASPVASLRTICSSSARDLLA